jgi:prevent-host-death family protein
MKQTILGASEFKARCLRLLDQVEENGDTLVITKRGRPIAKVMPLSPPKRSLRGSWKGRVRIHGDIVNFDTGRDWESNR